MPAVCPNCSKKFTPVNFFHEICTPECERKQRA